MPKLIKASVQVSVFALIDVLTGRNLSTDVQRATFEQLVTNAATRIFEAHFSGSRPDCAEHEDLQGSRIQFWITYRARSYTLLVYQFDYRTLPPLICTKAEDIVFGDRKLVDRFAASIDGDVIEIHDIDHRPASRRSPACAPEDRSGLKPTLHRLRAIGRAVARAACSAWTAERTFGIGFLRRLTHAAQAAPVDPRTTRRDSKQPDPISGKNCSMPLCETLFGFFSRWQTKSRVGGSGGGGQSLAKRVALAAVPPAPAILAPGFGAASSDPPLAALHGITTTIARRNPIDVPLWEIQLRQESATPDTARLDRLGPGDEPFKTRRA